MSRARRAIVAAVAAASLALIGLGACLSYDAYEDHDVDALRDDFAPVSEMLGARCGSLDCHGAPARSLRLYHHHGLRLDDDDVPGGDDTRDEEHAANFLSVTGLEPDATADVVANGGEGFDELVLYQKAYGLMEHKGGTVFVEATDADRCFVTWLAGKLDEEACDAAGTFARPSP